MLGAAGRELLFVDYATDVDDDDFVCYREQVASLKAVDPRESKVVVMAELLLYQPDYDKQVLVEFEFILWVTQAEKLLQVHLHLADLGKLGWELVVISQGVCLLIELVQYQMLEDLYRVGAVEA